MPCSSGDAGKGRIDNHALTKLVDFFSAKGHPMVVFNYNTTLKIKCTCDDVKRAGEFPATILKENNNNVRMENSRPRCSNFIYIIITINNYASMFMVYYLMHIYICRSLRWLVRMVSS